MANLTQLGELERLYGFLLVDKPAGIAFSSVIKAVKRKFNLVKVGHGGSLDAMASGLLVLLIGDANKFTDRVMGEDRTYEGTIRIGLKTNTGDIYGVEVPGAVPEADFHPDLKEFKGDIFQREPRFCSVRREGSAGYEVADTGEHEQFMAHVYRLELEGNSFRLKCTAKTIVRALADEMGAALESVRRTEIGKFTVEEAVPFGKLLEMEIRDFPSCVMPLGIALR